MKKIVFFFTFILIICFAMPHVNASTKKALLTGNEVFLRTGPGTNYNHIASLNIGSVYDLVDETLYLSESSCSNGWYKIKYSSSTTGYVCSSYISLITISDNSSNPNTSCEQEMNSLGFPSSYWSGLCALKEKHPTWKFNAVKTNLDWATVVDNESACGTSYIATSNQEYIDSSCKNAYKNTWYPASQKAVAYYMDPRNWLDEKYIFQFEYLKFDASLENSYPEGIAAILKNAAFYKYHTDLASTITTAGKNTQVSPIFLASRMLQELGSGEAEKDLYSGTNGYYNFFNIGVSDSCATSSGTTNCGTDYARSKGWDTPLKAIEGASSQLASSYINVGQYTTYFQKYNVVPTNSSKMFIHQYMTNVAAPSSESKSAYNSYNALGMLNLEYAFYIPVYLNMNASISNSNSGASGSVSGSGSSSEISTIVTSSGYKYSSGTISGISVGTDVSKIMSTLQAMGGNGNITIKNANGTKVTSGTIGTGYKISIGGEELEVVIKGDTSGDGKITALDLLQVQKQILGTYSLTGAYSKAADPSGDGKITALDLLQVQKQILGTYNISQ